MTWYWYAILIIAAFLGTVLCGPFVVPFMKRLKVGQTERENGVETHLKKNGTPTMGGVIFLVPVLVVGLICAIAWHDMKLLSLLFVTLGFSAVGFIDDLIKVVKKNKDGLLWYQKMVALFAISGLFAAYLILFAQTGTSISIGFWGKEVSLNLGWLYIPFVIFVLLAESNAVNLTDGLDGLCSGTAIIVFLFFAVTAIAVFPDESVTRFAVIFSSALIGFLLFNLHPALIFMGDTGSLAIGGAIGAMAVIYGHPLMLVTAGLLFVFEALSVILQVGYFKLTHGKRIFKMAPLHHHFEKCGWKETTVTYVFWAFTAVCCVLTYIFVRGF